MIIDEIFQYDNLIHNKYYLTYIKLAKKIINENRKYDSDFHENHHILPKCMGGTNVLPYTFKEHYIAHLLLTKFSKGYKDKRRMNFSLHSFFHFDHNRKLNLNHSSIIYVNHKKEFVKHCKLRTKSNNPRHDRTIYSFKHLDGSVFNGKRVNFINRKNLSKYDINGLINAYKKHIRWESKGWGIYIPELYLYSNEIPRKKRKKEILVSCENCAKLIDPRNYSRWHGDKCKSLISSC